MQLATPPRTLRLTRVRRRFRAIAAASLLLTAQSFTSQPITSTITTITVDMSTSPVTVSPGSPTLNPRETSSVVIDVSPKNQAYGYSILVAGAEVQNSNWNTRAVLEFVATSGKSAGPPKLQSSIWVIPYTSHLQVVSVEINEWDSTRDNASFIRTYVVPIQLDPTRFNLNWSAGFTVSGLRDDRFRLDSIPNDSQHLTLVPLTGSSLAYSAAAFANYCMTSLRWFCWSAGLGLDIPVSGIELMLGPSLRIKPLASSNSGLLTGGLIYGPRKRISADFQGRTMVPAGTTQDSLLSTRYDVQLFIALSFSFLGGENEFKGVFSSRTNPAPTPTQTPVPAPPAPPPGSNAPQPPTQQTPLPASTATPSNTPTPTPTNTPSKTPTVTPTSTQQPSRPQ
jgi:hypothetical protein